MESLKYNFPFFDFRLRDIEYKFNWKNFNYGLAILETYAILNIEKEIKVFP